MDHLKGELAKLPAPGIWRIHWLRWEKVLAVDFDSQANLTTCFGSRRSCGCAGDDWTSDDESAGR